MRPHNASASSIECVVSTTQRPCLNLSIRAQMLRFVSGSNPVDGSSKKTTGGFPMSAMAREREKEREREEKRKRERTREREREGGEERGRERKRRGEIGLP